MKRILVLFVLLVAACNGSGPAETSSLAITTTSTSPTTQAPIATASTPVPATTTSSAAPATTTQAPPTTTSTSTSTTTSTTTMPPTTTSTTTTQARATTTTAAPATTVVGLGDFYSSPASITIATGDRVKWVLESGTHDTTSFTGLWQSHMMTEIGDSWSRTFDAPGTYEYYCTIHVGLMNGVVNVTE